MRFPLLTTVSLMLSLAVGCSNHRRMSAAISAETAPKTPNVRFHECTSDFEVNRNTCQRFPGESILRDACLEAADLALYACIEAIYGAKDQSGDVP